jgi:hypothetical protein
MSDKVYIDWVVDGMTIRPDDNPLRFLVTLADRQVGDLVYLHGIVAVVIEKLEGLGFIYQTSAGKRIAYNAKWTIEPIPKRIWILEGSGIAQP